MVFSKYGIAKQINIYQLISTAKLLKSSVTEAFGWAKKEEGWEVGEQRSPGGEPRGSMGDLNGRTKTISKAAQDIVKHLASLLHSIDKPAPFFSEWELTESTSNKKSLMDDVKRTVRSLMCDISASAISFVAAVEVSYLF